MPCCPHPLAAVARVAALTTVVACLPALAAAASFEVLHPFDGTHGAEPFGGVRTLRAALDPAAGMSVS